MGLVSGSNYLKVNRVIRHKSSVSESCSVYSIQLVNEMLSKSSIHFKYYNPLTTFDYNEYIQHTTNRLREYKDKTRSSRTGSLTSSSCNVQFRICGIRTSSTNPHKRNISNWNDRYVMGNCCKIGTEIEKIGLVVIHFPNLFLYFYNYYLHHHGRSMKGRTFYHAFMNNPHY